LPEIENNDLLLSAAPAAEQRIVKSPIKSPVEILVDKKITHLKNCPIKKL